MSVVTKMVDYLAAGVVTVGGPLFRSVGNWPGKYPAYLKQADKARVQWRSTHYYQPTYTNSDLPADVTGERNLPGIDLREAEQLALIDSFAVQDELSSLTEHDDSELAFRYDNGQYGYGDAEALYAMVRKFKPKRIFEIGSGHSTRIAQKAITRNRAEDPTYDATHICVEPYERHWLERLGPQIIRAKVETLPLSTFDLLGPGDILFIDSSHVIRPFGDVLFEFHQIIPSLKKGVVVHVHDIFTPRDYHEHWLRDQRRLWNEQYLLEAMLAHSPRYRVVLAMNWLVNNHRAKIEAAFPTLKGVQPLRPGSFWFEIAG